MTNENNFNTASQSLILKTKVTPEAAFNYKGIADLENLIGFIGTAPKVNVDKGKMVLSFGKYTINDNSVVLRNSYGEVTKVLSYEDANNIYDIAAQSEFKPEHKNKVIEKIKKIPFPKAKGKK